MKLFIFLTSLFLCSTSYGNPGITKNTDIKSRKAESHSQVTRCEGDKCTVNTVTRFNKKTKTKELTYGECVFSEEKGIKVSQCNTTKKKAKAKKIVVKVKKKEVKRNRVQAHLGYGPNGVTKEEDNNRTTVKENRELLMGLQYTRVIEDGTNLGVSLFTNKTLTLSIGFDY